MTNTIRPGIRVLHTERNMTFRVIRQEAQAAAPDEVSEWLCRDNLGALWTLAEPNLEPLK